MRRVVKKKGGGERSRDLNKGKHSKETLAVRTTKGLQTLVPNGGTR